MSDMEHNKDLLTIQGIVIASDWNTEGNVTRIAVMTDDEQEFFIFKNKYWGQLLAHLREPVKILGVMDIDDGKVSVYRGEKDMPEMVINSSARDFIDLVTGYLSETKAMMSGRLAINGGPATKMKVFMSLF